MFCDFEWRYSRILDLTKILQRAVTRIVLPAPDGCALYH